MTNRDSPTPHSIIHIHRLAARLKHLRRQGWIDRGADDPESTASHSWSVALLAWMLARDRDDLNRDRVLLLGLVHDLPEALAGDATPFDSDRNAQGDIPLDRFHTEPTYAADQHHAKIERESNALEEMLQDLDPALASDIRDAWQEYENAETPEARFVKQIDKLETLLQAQLYQSTQPHLIIDSFRLGAHRDITDPALRALLNIPGPGDPPTS